MFNAVPLLENLVLAGNLIPKEPGMIVGPIAKILGNVLNFIFNIVNNFTVVNSLGFAIIIITIITRIIILPLAFHQQKSMLAMRKLQPEMDKINKKYEGKTDNESMQKKNGEMQILQSKHGVNPFLGCLPLFIQMPIFVALNYILQQAYKYVGEIGNIYTKLATEVLNILSTVGSDEAYVNIISPLIIDRIPNKMALDLGTITDLERIIGGFSTTDWSAIFNYMTPESINVVNTLLEEKAAIEYFFGINLAGVAGLSFPGILIPILVAATSFLSSYLLNKTNTSTDSNVLMQQKIMLIVMPLVMGYVTINFSAGVGIYFITSTVFQVFQQLLLNKYYHGKDASVETISESVKKKK